MIEVIADFVQSLRIADRIKARPIRRSEYDALPQRVRNDQNIGK